MNEILREKIAREEKRHKVARDPEDLFQSISHEIKNTREEKGREESCRVGHSK